MRISDWSSDVCSSDLLKPDSRRFRGLRDAGALGLALAGRVGLDAASARLVDVQERPALLIERYDRVRASDGTRQRLHQEDFCQVLGYPEGLKYEASGGPGLAAISALVRKLALGPKAVQGVLDWVVFNALIGNADAHAKIGRAHTSELQSLMSISYAVFCLKKKRNHNTK